jgi:hypothetical protein
VFNMSNLRDWDVTVRGRIENVTDQDEFPGLFLAALRAESEISVVQFDYPTVPHTTSVVIRISADRMSDAESIARELILRIFLKLAREIIGDDASRRTLSIHVAPAPYLGPK